MTIWTRGFAPGLSHLTGASAATQIRRRILCVDGDADIREMLTALLGAEGYDATAVANDGDAVRLVARDRFDLFILDNVSSTDAGQELWRELRRRQPDTPIIIYSADVCDGHRRRASEAGAAAFVCKPNIRPLVRALKQLINQKAERHYSTDKGKLAMSSTAVR